MVSTEEASAYAEKLKIPFLEVGLISRRLPLHETARGGRLLYPAKKLSLLPITY